MPHPIAGQTRVVFPRPLVQSSRIEASECASYDSGNPARVVRTRYSEPDVARLLRAAP